MKQIVCEICEGTNLKKQEGFFVCSDCGAQYSTEEVKNMMTERNDAEYYIDLSNQALDDKDIKGMMDYLDKALEINPDCLKALLQKHSYLIILTDSKEDFCEIKDLRDRILFLHGDDKEIVSSILVQYHKKAIDIVLRVIRILSQKPEDKIRDEVLEEAKAYNRKYYEMQSRGYYNMQKVTAEDVFKVAYEKYDKQYRSPSFDEINFAMAFLNLCDDVDASILEGNESYCKSMTMSYTTFSDSLKKAFYCIEIGMGSLNMKPTDDAKKTNTSLVKKYADKALFFKGKLDEIKAEKQAEINRLYWEKNAVKKKELEEEKERISARIPELKQKVEEIKSGYDSELKKLYKISEDPVPAEIEMDKIKDRISGLRTELNNTSVFKAKQKKLLESQISECSRTLSELYEQSEEQRKEVRRNYSRLKDKVFEECKPFNQEIHDIEARVSIIERDLTKDYTMEEIENPDCNNFDINISNAALAETIKNLQKQLMNRGYQITTEIRAKHPSSDILIGKGALISYDLRLFMAFLASADGNIGEEEVKTFNEILNSETENSIEDIIKSAECASNMFLEMKKLPMCFDSAFVDYRIAKKCGIDTKDDIIAVYNIYRLIGRKIIMADGVADPTEAEMYSIPIRIIVEAAKEYGIELPYDDIANV